MVDTGIQSMIVKWQMTKVTKNVRCDAHPTQTLTERLRVDICSGGSRISRWGGGGAPTHWGVPTSNVYTFW